jgi:monoamine oxidase
MGTEPGGESDFAIVGAGLAGLRTALRLRATGATVTVFEARERVGGRVVSAPQPTAKAPPLVLDLGAQWVGPGQTQILSLIKELDLHLVPADSPGRALWDLGDGPRPGRASLGPLPPMALAEVLTGAGLITLMSRRLPPEPWNAPRALAWDRISAHDWITRHLRTSAGRAYARAAIEASYAIEPEETSLLSLLFYLRSCGPVRDFSTAEAFRLQEGTHEIASRLAGRLDSKIRFGEPVLAVTQDAAGLTVETAVSTVRCRRAAICVPPPLAGQISYTPALPASRTRLLASVRMGASIKFHAVYRRPFWRNRGLSGQAMSSTDVVRATYDNSPDDGTGRGVLVGFVLADAARNLGELDPAEQEKQILSSLGRLFGPDGAVPDAIAIEDWGAEEWTGGCYASHLPVGGWTSYGSAFRQPCGRIHWAGTETSSDWHGYMEGAIRSADRAADEMLRADAPTLVSHP